MNIESIIIHHQTIGDIDHTTLKMEYVLSYKYYVIACVVTIFGVLIVAGGTILTVCLVKKCLRQKAERAKVLENMEYKANANKERLKLLNEMFPATEYRAVHQKEISKNCKVCGKIFQEATKVRILRCGHVMDKACIDEIVCRKEQSECPECKLNIFN